MRRLLVLFWTPLFLLGCSKRVAQSQGAPAGDETPASASQPDLSCYPREMYCADLATALFCSLHASLATAPCRGPLGCSAGPAGIACDDSVAEEGDACVATDHAACSPDGKRALVCTPEHRFAALQACEGPDGCKVSAGSVRCDDTLATAGTACAREGEAACGADRKTALVCKGGAFSVVSPCGGPRGCELESGAVFCDRRVSSRDEACDHEGQLACSASGSSLLRCNGGRFDAVHSCDGPAACRVKPEREGDDIVCDDSVAVADEPCVRDGEPACSVDGRSYLVCSGYRFVHGGDCARDGCRYDAKLDAVRCDHKAVDRWPDGDLRTFVGVWGEHYRGKVVDRMTIDVGPDGKLRISKADCSASSKKPCEIQRVVTSGRRLQFDRVQAVDYHGAWYRYTYRLESVNGELRRTERAEGLDDDRYGDTFSRE